MSRVALGLLLALLAGMSTACGWHAGLVAPAPGRTVGVEVFSTGEDVLERNLEPLLHRELSRAVSDLVSSPLVAADEADLVLRGRILRYRRRGGVRTPEGELIETGVQIAASAELVDRVTGRAVRPAVEAHRWSGFTLVDPAAEAAARDRVLRSIAETLVLELFRPAAAAEPADAAGSRRAE
ncbi:MAG: LPS assembly lipoprotein LptE [Planctomycetota bacterium]